MRETRDEAEPLHPFTLGAVLTGPMCIPPGAMIILVNLPKEGTPGDREPAPCVEVMDEGGLCGQWWAGGGGQQPLYCSAPS